MRLRTYLLNLNASAVRPTHVVAQSGSPCSGCSALSLYASDLSLDS